MTPYKSVDRNVCCMLLTVLDGSVSAHSGGAHELCAVYHVTLTIT